MKPASNSQITIAKDGPYLVTGEIPVAEQHIVTNAEGDSLEWQEGRQFKHDAQFALCRCGHSKNKPFCDGSHLPAGFDGTETAIREPFARLAKEFTGPTMILKDADSLCAFARFCDVHGRIWNLIKQTDTPEGRKWVEHEAAHCPAGRLVAIDRATGRELEPQLPPSIGVVHDTEKQVGGPLWVRGGIPVVAADGHKYEVRNRVTLCRCGLSANKPFCDGAHAG